MAEMIVQPWDKPTDTGYTWYKDDSILRILPTGKTLTYDEVPEGGFVPLSFFVTGETGTVQIRTNKRINN